MRMHDPMHVEVCFVLMVDLVGLGGVVIFKSPGVLVCGMMQCNAMGVLFLLCFFFFVFAFVFVFVPSTTAQVFC